MTAPAVSLVIPAFNSAVPRGQRGAGDGFYEESGIDGEVVVADDGSTDGTADTITVRARPRSPPAARGKGAAVRAGMAATTGTSSGSQTPTCPTAWRPAAGHCLHSRSPLPRGHRRPDAARFHPFELGLAPDRRLRAGQLLLPDARDGRDLRHTVRVQVVPRRCRQGSLPAHSDRRLRNRRRADLPAAQVPARRQADPGPARTQRTELGPGHPRFAGGVPRHRHDPLALGDGPLSDADPARPPRGRAARDVADARG